MLASWTQQTQLSPTFIQHSFEQSVQLSYQVLSFENSRWAGLGRILGRCLRNHRKTPVSSVYRCLFPREGFPGQTYIKQVVWKHECKHGSSLECCITNILRQPSEELVPWELTPWHWSKQVKFRPSWLFHKGCLSPHSCQTAMLPHVGKLNSANSAFSSFHSTFIRAIGSVVLSSSFIWK